MFFLIITPILAFSKNAPYKIGILVENPHEILLQLVSVLSSQPMKYNQIHYGQFI